MAPAAPAACPFCRSTEIAVPEKVSVSTYWRCQSCGHMWNVSRQLAVERPTRWNRY
jgi:transposase-like protein